MTIYEATKEYLVWRKTKKFATPTLIQNESNLKQFAIFMRNCEVCQVQEKDVTSYFGMLENQMEVLNNSIIPKSAALRGFFKYWNDRTVDTLNYKLIPLPKKVPTFPNITTKEDFAKFWAEISRPSEDSRRIRNAALISLLAVTGIRNGEACSLQLDKIDTQKPIPVPTKDGVVMMYRGVIKTEKTRGMRPFREIFWTEEVNRHIKKWIDRRKEIHERHPFKEAEFVFVGLNSKLGEAGWGKRLLNNSVDEIFRVYSKKAGVDINPHMLRHMLGRDMAENGANEHNISDVLGHSRLDSSRIYTMLFGTAVAKQFYRFRGTDEIIQKETVVQAV
jgi:site-specific recombinase XerD